MISVAIIGSGGVAEGFARALSQSGGVSLVGVAGRNMPRVAEVARIGHCEAYCLDQLPEAELYILAVSDGAIEALRGLDFGGAVVVHTAGSVSMEGVDGVIYPMQSFTPSREIKMREVPIFIEGENPLIEEVAKALSDNVITMSSEQRLKLHMAAVFASNFVNAIFSATSEILADNSLNIELYKPLIEETVSKALSSGMTPQRAQTGPARRGDQTTQRRHLEALEEMRSENLIDIYKTISKYIWETSRRI